MDESQAGNLFLIGKLCTQTPTPVLIPLPGMKIHSGPAILQSLTKQAFFMSLRPICLIDTRPWSTVTVGFHCMSDKAHRLSGSGLTSSVACSSLSLNWRIPKLFVTEHLLFVSIFSELLDQCSNAWSTQDPVFMEPTQHCNAEHIQTSCFSCLGTLAESLILRLTMLQLFLTRVIAAYGRLHHRMPDPYRLEMIFSAILVCSSLELTDCCYIRRLHDRMPVILTSDAAVAKWLQNEDDLGQK